MEFVFLGTGTSAGIPAIGCDCRVCRSEDPRDRRLRTSAALRFRDRTGQDRVILIDASPDLRQQALRHDLRRCDAILFTHNHVDHTFGLDEVRRFNAVMGQPIDIFGSPHTLEHLARVYRHIFDRQACPSESFVATLIPHRLEAGRAVDLHGVRFIPIPLLHGRQEVFGYRIEPADPGGGGRGPFPLAFCTDVSGIPPQSWAMLEGLGTLVLDALRHRRHPCHFSLDQAVAVAHRVGARRTLFVHMAHDLPHAETEAQLPPGMGLAYDGMVLT